MDLGTHFDVTKHIRLVPPFQEKEVDKYFLHFEKVAENLKWPKEHWTFFYLFLASLKDFRSTVFCPGWISSIDANVGGEYDYHTILQWLVSTDDTNSNILLNLLYMDIEGSRGCQNDYLSVSNFSRTSMARTPSEQ